MFGSQNTNRFGSTQSAPAFGASFGQAQATPSFGSGFGQSQQTRTSAPFGTQAGLGFGNQTQTAGFGTTQPAVTSSPFGSNTTNPSFGGSTFMTPSAGIGFGSSNTTALGGSTPFRSSPAFNNSTTQQPLAFGATPAFGANTSNPFGATTQNNPFGAAPAASTFGNTQATPFGAAQTNPFGSMQNTTFGGSTGFSGNTNPTPFGGNTGSSGFGGASTGTSAFPSFGNTSSSAFGNTQTAPFGANPSTAFGNPATPFGNTATTFGNTANPATSALNFGGTGLGASNNAFRSPSFGASTTSTFGTNPAAPTFGTGTGFGSTSTGFPSTTAVPSFGIGGGFNTFGNTQIGTSGIAFTPNMIKDTVSKNGTQSSTTSKLQCISGMTQFESKSLEELRWEDYQKGNRSAGIGSTGFGVSANNTFGTSSMTTPFNVPQNTAPFGNTQTNFGSTTTAPFGSLSTPFGSSNMGSGLANTSPFANKTATTTAFTLGNTGNTQTNSFGFNAPGQASTNPFGFNTTAQPTSSTNPFGGGLGSGLGSTVSNPFGGSTLNTNSTFGQQPQQTNLGGMSTSFGQSQQQQQNPFGSTSFGTFQAKPATSTLGTFPTSTFGTSGPISNVFGGLGTTFNSSFPSSASTNQGLGSGFGNLGQFNPGSVAQGSNVANNFNFNPSTFNTSFTPANNLLQTNQIQPIYKEVNVAQKIEFLKKKRDELDHQQKQSESKPVEIPRFSFNPSDIIRKPLTTRSTGSVVKIHPRGYRSVASPPISETKNEINNRKFLSAAKSTKRLIITDTSRRVPFEDSVSKDYLMETPSRRSAVTFDIGEKTGLTPVTTESPNISYYRDSSDTEVIEIPEVTGSITAIGPPLLENNDYFTVPDMNVLLQMSDMELRRIKDFAVYRPEFGQIVWDGETDIRGLNLDKIVVIQHKEVRVYEDYKDQYPTPNLGEGLNKPATITLYNIFPKSDNKKDNYIDKLKSFCKDNDAEFIEYDSESGIWSFHVNHFSKYGLVDDDDDDDDDDENSSEINKNVNINLAEEDSLGNQYDNTQRNDNIKKLVIKSSNQDVDDNDGADESKVSFNYPETTSFREPISFERKESRRIFKTVTPISSGPISSRKRTLSKILSSRDDESISLENSIIEQIIENQLVLNTTDDNKNQSYSGRIAQPLLLSDMATTVRNGDDDTKMSDIIQSCILKVKNKTINSTNSPTVQLLQAVKSKYFEKRYIDDLSRISTLPNQPIKDFQLAMRKSFRVSFSPHGTIAHLGELIFTKESLGMATYNRNRTVVIERINPLQWFHSVSESEDTFNTSKFSLYNEPLSMILKQSFKEPNNVDLPLWIIPKCYPNEIHEYIPFLNIVRDLQKYYSHSKINSSDWYIYKAISLVNVSIGQEEKVFYNAKSGSYQHSDMIIESQINQNQDFIPFYDNMFDGSTHSQFTRRKRLLTDWLSDLCESKDDVDDFNTENDYYNQIFNYLLCHNITAAISVCEDNALFRLAMLLSQIDSDKTICHLIRHQLDLWKAMDESNQLVPLKLLHIYRLIAGDLFVNDIYSDSIVFGYGWAKAISGIYWYSLNIEEIVDNCVTNSILIFDIALRSNQVDKPLSQFSNTHNYFSYPRRKNGLFSLLKCLYTSNIDDTNNNLIIDALDPLGYTSDLLDYRVSYYLLVLLQSMNIINEVKHGHIIGIILSSFISQLLNDGQYHYAIFIAFQIVNPNLRINFIKTIILQYSGSYQWENNKKSIEYFLINDLSLPESFVYEASGYRLMYDFNYYNSINNLLLGKQYDLCLDMISVHIYPSLLFQTSLKNVTTNEIIELIETIKKLNYGNVEYVDLWNNNSDILLTYLKFKSYIQDQYPNDLSNQSNNLMTLFEDILDSCYALLQRLAIIYKNYKLSNEIKPKSNYWVMSLYDMGSYLYKVFCNFIYEVIYNNLFIIDDKNNDSFYRTIDLYIDKLYDFIKNNYDVPILSNFQVVDDLLQLKQNLINKINSADNINNDLIIMQT